MNHIPLEKDAILFLDGGMGTQLQGKGLQPGEMPEAWNVSRPKDILAVHEAYFKAGADIVYANTFGANPAKYHGSAPIEDVIAAGISIAREAATTVGGKRGVALDIGPTGRLLKPFGDFEFDAAYDAFAEQVRIGEKAGADLAVIETMGDTYELKAAVLAARENSSIPIFATVALGEDGKLLTGADVECVAAILEGLRVDAIGLNCGFGPDRMLPFVKRLAACTSLPLIVKPNAGLPQIVDGRTVFTVGPEEFAKDIRALAEAGASIVGGCCGTTPAHIAAVREALSEFRRPSRTGCLPKTMVASGSRAVEIPFDDSIVIGERINPTGKKKLKAALTEGDVAYVLREAVSQSDAGAHVLDVNVGVPGIDEAATLDSTIQAVQGVTDIPLQIDTSDANALERALRHYNGKALVNSVNGKKESMDAVLPLIAKYGGAVVALTLDENGIPPTAEGRLAIARRILERGAEYGLKPSDFIIDVLCLAISADAGSANTILRALRMVREELGCRTCLGVSNISFGLPARPLLNASFYTMALANGLSAGIINPLATDMMTAYRAYRALAGKDRSCCDWIEAYKDFTPASAAAPNHAKGGASAPAAQSPDDSGLSEAIRHGLKSDAASLAASAIKDGKAPLDVIGSGIVPALEAVGKGFESGSVFLPQLLMAAEAAGAAFDVVRGAMPSRDGESVRGPIIVATVKGDIHDIGKNICRALLENYGFKVIDLGRDVPPEKVVDAARRENARLVGLSALMTTTVGFMEQTVKLVHEELPGCKVTVGGAVLTDEYARKIGADFYSKDAMELVRLAESLFPNGNGAAG
ncbi:MAG: homocysteine S-methyltransferase family protein [Verrucomicrobiota bacterium]|nr:homocysteine S-methyltransferase family protein [Verrucomicrobiota bacterium]